MSNTSVSLRQGGDNLDVASGGNINMADGAKLNLADGSEIDLADGAVISLGSGITFTVSGTNLIVAGLPTSDPSVAGALWTNSNVLTRSAG